MFTREDYLKYHCPRWEEYPDIGLYMDQVVSILERALAIFAEDDDSKLLTSTMLNNYVKQKVVTPPHKKRYERIHLAYFFSVCLLKRFLNISEISVGMSKLLEECEPDKLYNCFCDEVEYSLRHAFAPDDYPELASDAKSDIPGIAVIRSLTNAYANVLFARQAISALDVPKSKVKAEDESDDK